MSTGIKELCEQIIEKEQGNSLYEWGVKLFYNWVLSCFISTEESACRLCIFLQE